jgi:PAP2 superfamily
MRRGLRWIDTEVLPNGWRDVIRQVALFAAAYGLYQLVRGLIGTTGYKPFGDATKIVNLERSLHVFIEPSVQAWAQNIHVLMDLADWMYLYSQYVVTFSILLFIYLRKNESFYFVRNMFLIAMGLALIGYSVYPTAPPRLMPEWGFTDSIRQWTGITAEHGATSAFVNFYAAVPSMHVCFSLMIGIPMARLVKYRPLKVLWCIYPLFITFVVMATANHFLTDAFLGACTAGLAALASTQLLARARPDVWAFSHATA